MNQLRTFRLIAALGLLLVSRVTAQNFTTLHSFTRAIDGNVPELGVISSGNIIYGTARTGGDSDKGTVFKMNTDGSGFMVLHSFTGGGGAQNPYDGVVLSGNMLYGMTFAGGDISGTIFAINTNGTGFTNLYKFNGGNPVNGLIISGNNLYGATWGGGFWGRGAVFKANIDGTSITNLYSFFGGSSEGANPQARLVLVGDTLYGTTQNGGPENIGTVFAINTNGLGFTNLHNFSSFGGVHPDAGLTFSGKTLYGTTISGGISGSGTVFAINTNGTGFTNLYSFVGGSTNHDGDTPYAELTLSSNVLYGVTSKGGYSGSGTVFKINTNGTGFMVLYSFTARADSFPYDNGDGAYPYSRLILSSNILYGTGGQGGSSGDGTVFSLDLRPTLSYARTNNQLMLSWPTNEPGFYVEVATNIPPAWASNALPITIANGRYTSARGLTNGLRFWRLRK